MSQTAKQGWKERYGRHWTESKDMTAVSPLYDMKMIFQSLENVQENLYALEICLRNGKALTESKPYDRVVSVFTGCG